MAVPVNATVTVGKSELLAWAKATTGITPCAKYDDLKDGLILLSLMESLFPNYVQQGEVRAQRVGRRNPTLNRDLLAAACSQIGLPKHICDRKGIIAGHQRPCYNMLVMFFFLSKLASSAEFSVDFTNPIDDELAAFLQSPQSVACLQQGGGSKENKEAAFSNGTSSRNDNRVASTVANAVTNRQLLDESAFDFSNIESARLSPQRTAGSRNEGITTQQRGSPLTNPAAAPHSAAAAHRGDSLVPHLAAVPYDYNSALSAAVTSWGSANSSTVGEVLIARLKRDLRHALEAKANAIKELSHVKAIGRSALEGQRVLAEAELERLRGVMHTQLATHRDELSHSYAQAVAEAHAEVQRALDEATVEREHLQFDLGAQSGKEHLSSELRFDQLYTELLELRQQKQLLLARIRLQEQQVQKSKEVEGALLNTIKDQQAGFDRVQTTLVNTTRKLSNTKPIVPSQLELVFESLSPAEQFPLVARVRQLESELEAAIATRTSLENEVENLKSHIDEDSRRVQGSPIVSELHLECSRLKKDNERLGRINRYLVQSSRMGVKHPNDEVRPDEDFHAVRLDASLTVPSAMISNTNIAAINAEALAAIEDTIKVLNGQDNAAGISENLRRAYWSMASATSILQSRVEMAASTLGNLYNRHASTQKELVTQRHTAQSELKALEAQLVRDRDDSVAMANKHLQEIELQLEITREDLAQSKAAMGGSIRQLQIAGQSLLADCERFMREPKARIEALQRADAQSKAREATWQELTEALRLTLRYSMNNGGRIQSADEERINELASRIAKGPPHGDTFELGRGDELSASIRDAISHLQQRWEGCIKEIIAIYKQNTAYSERATAQGMELVAAKSDLARAAEFLKALDRKCENLKDERAQAADAQSEAIAKLKALEDAHRDYIAESQAQYEKAVAILHSVPIGGLSGEVSHQLSTKSDFPKAAPTLSVDQSQSLASERVAANKPRSSTFTGGSASFNGIRAGTRIQGTVPQSQAEGVSEQTHGMGWSSGALTTTYSGASSLNDIMPQSVRSGSGTVEQTDSIHNGDYASAYSNPKGVGNSPSMPRPSTKGSNPPHGGGKVSAPQSQTPPQSFSAAPTASQNQHENHKKGLVLSAEEMERRKNEILAKYGVK